MPVRQTKVGAILKAGREARGLSLRAAGTEARLEFKSIYGYENGIEPGFSYAVILCDVYGLELEALAAAVMDNDGRKPQGRKRGGTNRKNGTMGSLLKAAREASGLTTRGVAEETTIDYASISRYENNRVEPGLRAAVILCDFYDIDLQVLADIVREKYREELRRGGEANKAQQGKKTWYLCDE